MRSPWRNTWRLGRKRARGTTNNRNARTTSNPAENGGIVMLMLSRRTVLLAPLAAPMTGLVTPLAAAPGKMELCMHQGTSRAAGFRKSLEGWAKAGIKNVELSDTMLEDFLKTDTL